MNIILLLLACSMAIGGGGLVIFLWALRAGQYDDLDGSASRILFDEE
ncbi:MAG TPA: cbb3-type cytochrome oxidase assembly protein CcoS [Rhodopila sp.]|nr:cbb3-type cytochrome oxidase assembly protein CcoS [Rhodopila sp.]